MESGAMPPDTETKEMIDDVIETRRRTIAFQPWWSPLRHANPLGCGKRSGRLAAAIGAGANRDGLRTRGERGGRECGATVSNLGSIFFEEMSCAGYDPQRRQFAAPIKIKQAFGFGGAPLPGSREYVLHCVADAGGILRPVGRDSVHLANAINQAPTWQFAVIANASENLPTVYPMNGQTRRAISILSWGLIPTDCNYTPTWGNALNYRIRLDQ